MITGAMSSSSHVDARASKRRRLKDGVDAGASRRPSPSHAEPEPELKPKSTPTNYLLACYMAHEFLTRGTLLGRRFPQKEAEPASAAEQRNPTRQAYADLSCLLKDDSVHLPGIVNPTQLARCFLKLVECKIELPESAVNSLAPSPSRDSYDYSVFSGVEKGRMLLSIN